MIENFPEKKTHFLLPGPAGDLEVMTTFPEAAELKGVSIICHPDPRQEGAMHNKVVTILSQAFNHAQLATVRFNFRGVGASAGTYGDTVGELADLQAVLAWVKTVLPAQDIWLAGFSFGSYISALAAQKIQPRGLISIAPPVNHYDFNQFTDITCPWLVIQGDQDEVVPFGQVQTWATKPPSPLKFIVMQDVSHFFHGRLIELREHIESWLQEVM